MSFSQEEIITKLSFSQEEIMKNFKDNLKLFTHFGGLDKTKSEGVSSNMEIIDRNKAKSKDSNMLKME